MDILGLGKQGWNPSVYINSSFPERGMHRTLAAFDAPKHADYNFRAETLTRPQTGPAYLSRSTSKLQVSERAFLSEAQRSHPDLARPPKQRIGEQYVHAALAQKRPWNVSTEPLTAKLVERLADAELQAGRAAAKALTAGGPARETLAQREARFLDERRAQKRESAQARAAGLPDPCAATAAAEQNFYRLTQADFAELTMQVPVKRVTTWSLGTI